MNEVPDVAQRSTPSLPPKPARIALAAAFAFTAFGAHAEAVSINNLDLFVDPPSAFAFIKMPQGWKFLGKLDAQSMRSLPAGVHTALLPTDAEDVLFSIVAPAPAGTAPESR